MPRFPALSPTITAMSGSRFSEVVQRARQSGQPICPLHIGDTWMPPAQGCRMEDFTAAEHPGLNRYAPVQGVPALLAAITAQCTERMQVPTASDQILVTAGATGGLGAALGAMLDPGDEVIIPTPYWPLIAGIVRTFRGKAVEAPFFGEAQTAEQAVALLEAGRTDRTVAVYINSPNNPTGRLIPRSWMQAIVQWATDHDLWLIADEVYEHCVFAEGHVYVRSLAPDRTFSVHSFSKAFGMAGNRCGYVVCPPAAMVDVRKVSTHTFYSAPTASQLAAARVLEGPGLAWAAEAREKYRALGEMAAERLGLPAPEGSTFLFVDVSSQLSDQLPEGESGALGAFMNQLADQGLLLAPGPRFGPYPNHVRVCFTSAAPEIITRGIDILCRALDR
ncbi:MAG: pyridoxal phosphate-dependent aminotransferase [Bradymonadia bacterium]